VDPLGRPKTRAGHWVRSNRGHEVLSANMSRSCVICNEKCKSPTMTMTLEHQSVGGKAGIQLGKARALTPPLWFMTKISGRCSLNCRRPMYVGNGWTLYNTGLP
jgi:hypothetical protein